MRSEGGALYLTFEINAQEGVVVIAKDGTHSPVEITH